MIIYKHIRSTIFGETHLEPKNILHSQVLQCSVFSSRTSHPEPNRYIYHSDHLGSSTFLTDANGTPTQHLQYLPFGETFIEQRSITSYYTPYTFSAKERDTETGYSFFGARYYDADISIWLSVDPMADKAPGWTPYRYCFQNPINNTDITGLLEDGYTVDEWGNFERVDKTGGETFDVIFNKAAYQAGKKEYDETGTKSGIKIEKSILKSHKKINIMIFDRDGHDTGVRRTNDRYEVNSDKKATNLFEFLANNTKVEWSNTYLINPETGKTINSLCTSHEEGTISGGTNVIYKYTDQGYLVKRMDHNHPSGSSKASSDDKESASLYHSTPDVKFRVYAKKHYYPYSPQK